MKYRTTAAVEVQIRCLTGVWPTTDPFNQLIYCSQTLPFLHESYAPLKMTHDALLAW